MRMTTVAVIVPSIPPRKDLLKKALGSVADQARMPDQVLVAVDRLKEGPMALRNRMVWKAGTEWVAFLDDDDEFMEGHLEGLLCCAEETGADLIYPWFDLIIHGTVSNDANPLACWGEDPFGREFDDEAARCIKEKSNFIPMTCLIRREALMDVGGFQPHNGAKPPPNNQFEDWGTWIAMLNAGCEFVHLPERTWKWNWNGKSTSGRTDVW